MKNGTGKILKVLKEYFIFSTGERKGIIYLLILLFLLICAPLFYDFIIPQQQLNISITDLKSLDDEQKDYAYESNEIKSEKVLFRFDPNTASDNKLSQLGFTEKNIKTIRNYLTKGGKFHNPGDLKKIYGIKPELFEKLEPFISIKPVNNFEKKLNDTSQYLHKGKSFEVVELNSADSAQLVALYRIGPSLAHRIIEYRSKLGGFISIDQLKELWKFDEDILYDLKDKIRVDESKARIFGLNSVTLDELKTHPYFKFRVSNAIINYRIQHGSYKSMEDLRKIVLVDDSIYTLITPYLKIK